MQRSNAQAIVNRRTVPHQPQVEKRAQTAWSNKYVFSYATENSVSYSPSPIPDGTGELGNGRIGCTSALAHATGGSMEQLG
jgi:hypothetical protein